MGCGSSSASSTVVRSQSPTPSQRAQEIEITLRLDGENVDDVQTERVRRLLSDQLGERDDRFTVSGDVPNIMHCIIHPRDNLDTALRHMAERQAILMIARQIKNRAADGQLALDRAIITEVALPGEQLKNEEGLRSSLMLRETIREVWQQADTDKNGSLDTKEFRNIMLSEKLGLGLQESEVDQILQKVDRNGDSRVVFSEFLPLCKEILSALYSELKVETASDWCQLWSIKTGHYYYNKRTGKYQFNQPVGFNPLPDREIIQSAPSEPAISEVEPALEDPNETTKSLKDDNQQLADSGAPKSPTEPTAETREANDQDGNRNRSLEAADSGEPTCNAGTENPMAFVQRSTDSGIDDASM